MYERALVGGVVRGRNKGGVGELWGRGRKRWEGLWAGREGKVCGKGWGGGKAVG